MRIAYDDGKAKLVYEFVLMAIKTNSARLKKLFKKAII